MQPISQPPPFLGYNEKVPVAALESPYCEELFNFIPKKAGGLAVRKGNSMALCITMPAGGAFQVVMAAYGQSFLFNLVYNITATTYDIYNVETGAVTVGVIGAGASYNTYAPFYFNKYLFLFSSTPATSGSIVFNGAAWGASGYTGAGTFNPYGGTVYKNRAYLIQIYDSSYWYSGIDAISGALTKVDLSGVIKESAYLYIIAPITLADTVESVPLLAFVFSSGEVLFYNGSYPNSVDWELVGEAKIPAPSFYHKGMKYQGDYLVFTNSGVVSLRDMFLKGSSDGNSLTISENISVSIAEALESLHSVSPTSPGIFDGVWDSENDRIILIFQQIGFSDGTFKSSNDGGGNIFFAFYPKTLTWCLHDMKGYDTGHTYLYANNITPYKYALYFVGSQGNSLDGYIPIWKKEGATGFQDRNFNNLSDVSYEYEILSAPIPVRKSNIVKVEGMEVIVKSDLYNETNYQLVKDLGVTTTTAQKTTAPVGTLQKPFINMGIEGNYVQYKISGTTTSGKTVGYELYGVNIWVNEGAAAR